MPNYIRWREQGATYFFTVVTYDRRRLFDVSQNRRLFCRAITGIRRKLPFDMPVYVLLPDHLHCIWTLPDNDDDFPRRWRQIKERFTREFLASGGSSAMVSPGQRAQSRRGVWQPRYWEHRIRDERDYFRHRDYVHLNPVKHGHVQTPDEWPWSSFHRHVRLGWLDPRWPGASPVDLPNLWE